MAGVPTSARASVACSLSVEASLLDVHSEEASLPFASQSSPDERTGGKSRLKTANGRARLRYRTSTLDDGGRVCSSYGLFGLSSLGVAVVVLAV